MGDNSLTSSQTSTTASITSSYIEKYDIGRLWSGKTFGEGNYEYIVSLSVLTFWLVVSIIPVYNKIFFQKKYYPYPIATAGIQLAMVSLLLITFQTIHHFTCSSNKNSWIFGPNFWWKIKWVAPIGILFGLKYAISNLGLQVVPAPTHLLLQSTDIVWTLLAAWFINKERVTPIGMLCVLGCVAGTICLTFQIHATVAAPFFAICVNLTSPILLGLCITTLRRACMELMRGDNAITSSELTALKLVLSSSIAFILALLMEGKGHKYDVSWYDAFLALPTSTQLGVIGGAIPILAFQVNCTFLTFLTSSVSVGLVGQVKIIPQWTAAFLFAPNVDLHLSWLNILGAILTIMSAITFAWNNYVTSFRDVDDSSEYNDFDEEEVIGMDDNIISLDGEHVRLLDKHCCDQKYSSMDE